MTYTLPYGVNLEAGYRHEVINYKDRNGFKHTKMLIHFPWDKPVDYGLLGTLIDFNIADKADVTTFWRSESDEDITPQGKHGTNSYSH